MTETLLAGLGRYVPEIIIIVTMMFLLYLESAYKKDEKRTYMYISTTIGFLSAIIVLMLSLSEKATGIFTNAVVIDPFSTFVKITLILGALGTMYLSKLSNDIYSHIKGEYIIMINGVLIGGMLLCSANNLLTVYLGIETLSILSYAMASFKKNNTKSSEAGLKYVLYGGIASGIMLFGMSHVFGVLGTIQFSEIAPMMASLTKLQVTILLPSFVLFFAGIGYKLACVPFHMWSPDVYEGSPIPVTAFFAIVPKIAAIAALIRITFVFFSEKGVMQDSWVGLLTLISILTMTVGNLTALTQKSSVKRMLAYSSISHAGFMLMGVTVINKLGTSSILFYGLVYVFMTLTAFYVVSFVTDKYDSDHFDRFNGLVKKHPFVTVCLGISLLSLAGLPPFGGFVAKYNIFVAVVKSGNYTLALFAAINSVVALYYYMKLVRHSFLNEKENEEVISELGFLNQLTIVAITIPIVVLGIFWQKIYHAAEQALIMMN